MSRAKKVLGCLVVAVVVLVVAAATGLRLRYGGGEPYPNLARRPVLPETVLETVVTYHEPIGNVAVSGDGRVFFTAHPEARPEGPRLLEWVGDRAVAYPDEARQDELFRTPLGVVVDRQQRLWTVDPADHGLGKARLLAFDLATGAVAVDIVLDRAAAPLGSFLQDLQVTPDGATVVVADVSFWRKSPSLVVVDVATGGARRVLERHPSVRPQDWIIETPAGRMVFFGGLAALKPGVDGIAMDPAGRWLAFGAMTHDTLYRVPVAALLDPGLTTGQIGAAVEDLGPKPLSDGLSADRDGGVWITDVEHGAVLRRAPGGLETWIRSPRIRWADALSWGPGGWLYVADSAIPDQMLRSRRHIAAAGPYHVFRFHAQGIEGAPGQ
ncbi:MAG TPA: L-dopachrome tautomerase-related protein [Methylomirabilota bacterium]|nr:L-dopachrome tautomerase-related protein [Methylomirabilota bacterium]